MKQLQLAGSRWAIDGVLNNAFDAKAHPVRYMMIGHASANGIGDVAVVAVRIEAPTLFSGFGIRREQIIQIVAKMVRLTDLDRRCLKPCWSGTHMRGPYQLELRDIGGGDLNQGAESRRSHPASQIAHAKLSSSISP